jgi:hypothetical protein
MASNRRRRRSVRITVAVLLLVVAGLVVLAALYIAELVVLAGAAVAALSAGVVGVRLVLTELVRSRRDAAEDRAAQARAYQKLDARRAEEHATFADQITSRLEAATSTVSELQGTIRLAERRTELAEQRARHESRRRGELQTRYDTLASATDAGADAEKPQPEPSEAAPDAKPQWDPDVPTVVDLLSWEDRDIDRSDVSEADGRLA